MKPDTSWIDDLAATQKPGWSMDAPFYTDAAIFARDRKHVFEQQWVMAGHVAQIPNAGDYFLLDFGGDNLILIRTKTGEIQALFNICRHRGSRVLLEPSGNAGSLVCPYHGWNYAQDGTLRIAPRMPENFDRECFGLRRAHVQILEGLIFICLAEESPPRFDHVAEGLAPFLKLHGMANNKVAKRQVYPVSANWKLVVENYLECYHCKPAHPEYCVVEIKAEKAGDGRPAGLAAFEQRMEEWRPEAEARGTWIPDYNSNSSHPEQRFFGTAYRSPLRASHPTGSRKGKNVAPLLGTFSEHDGGETAVGAGPFSFILAYEDYVACFQFNPIDALRSEMIVTWLVCADAVEGTDYDAEKVAWLWHVTSEQDKSIIEHNAAGVGSAAYTPGPASVLEGDVVAFRNWYLNSISPSSVSVGPDSSGGRYFPG